MSHPYPTLPTAPQEQPPSYDEAQLHSDAPPSYEELFGELRRVDSPSALAVIVKKIINVIADTVAAAVVLALLNVIPIAMIVIGSLNRNNCPVQEKVPVWLIVAGTASLVKSAINFAYRFRDAEHRKRPLVIRVFEGLLGTFILVWFILGTIWVYWSYGHASWDATDSKHYCDQLTFMLSFLLITITYALAFLSCCCICCCCCCVCLRKPTHTEIPPIPPVGQFSA